MALFFLGIGVGACIGVGWAVAAYYAGWQRYKPWESLPFIFIVADLGVVTPDEVAMLEKAHGGRIGAVE